ncbi:uncharacterized protein BDZ99DRAFT_494527 [Mytilinidion resinicola]|uniref:Uncharacterized protein n=1 Tax=Mytilinidion resinicola TaxID=574789 RepID=A0A6A6Z0E7_9PEZI|nr:uncharacterized protein BDZ99DRAFT_494527 [Mytilinidion resinicola]KAF2814561.1 hypothetical protein BDZ99DRAFT_494527 [Mytilinidion resinicola]
MSSTRDIESEAGIKQPRLLAETIPVLLRNRDVNNISAMDELSLSSALNSESNAAPTNHPQTRRYGRPSAETAARLRAAEYSQCPSRDFTPTRSSRTDPTKRSSPFSRRSLLQDCPTPLRARFRSNSTPHDKLFRILIDAAIHSVYFTTPPRTPGELEWWILTWMYDSLDTFGFKHFCSISSLEDLLVALVKHLEGEFIRQSKPHPNRYFMMRRLVADYGAPYPTEVFDDIHKDIQEQLASLS